MNRTPEGNWEMSTRHIMRQVSMSLHSYPVLRRAWRHWSVNCDSCFCSTGVVVQRLCRCFLTCVLVCLTFCWPALAEELRPWRVDFNPNDDRRDVLSRHADNWRVVPAESISKTIGDVTVTLRRVGHAGTRLTWGWSSDGHRSRRPARRLGTLARTQSKRCHRRSQRYQQRWLHRVGDLLERHRGRTRFQCPHPELVLQRTFVILSPLPRLCGGEG